MFYKKFVRALFSKKKFSLIFSLAFVTAMFFIFSFFVFKKNFFYSKLFVSHVNSYRMRVLNLEGRENITLKLGANDNIFNLMLKEKFDKQDIFKIADEINKYISISELKAGDILRAQYSYSTFFNCVASRDLLINYCEPQVKKDIIEVFLRTSKGNKVSIIKNTKDGTFLGQLFERHYTKKYRKIQRNIESSFLVDTVYGENGIKPSTAMVLIDAYSYIVDFQRDVRKNDKVVMVVQYEEDQDGYIKNEQVILSDLVLSGKSNKIILYKDKYYKYDGTDLRGFFIRTPVDGARISSLFNRNRKHPILGYTRAHLGVDFAAPTGTPVYVSADGTVIFMGYKSGYGNVIYVRHPNNYETRYAHLSAFRKNLFKGKRVSQKDVIAYVGKTGLASGPHLHYEMLHNGVHINPQLKNLKNTSKQISKSEMIDFVRYRNEIENHF
jgi:murein DD-endopeptidase MepM/ murein hydrolase activator NlpD